MRKVDVDAKQTADAKNALEEYCYSMRDKLVDSLSTFVTAEVNEGVECVSYSFYF